MTELRQYQRELLGKVRSALRSTDKPVMMQLPTGGGKTNIAASLLSDHVDRGHKAVWLTHRKELATQTANRLNHADIPTTSQPDWQPGSEAPWIAKGVVVLMAQTVGRRQRTIPGHVWASFDSDDLMVIDEAHHAAAKRWEEAIRQWPGLVLGMTATPWRLSRKEGFDHLFGELVLGPQVHTLQDEKYLCQAQVLVPIEDNRILGGGEVSTVGDYTEKGIEEANKTNNEVMTARAFEFWRKNTSNRQTIVYAVSVVHACNLAHIFREQGIAAEVILGDTHPMERAKRIKQFSEGELRVLVNVAVATEGFDLPDASCIVITRPTKSLSLYLQMVGRGLRPKNWGGNCLILDLAGNAMEHGLPENDRQWSLKARGDLSDGENSAPVARCDECQTASPAASHFCVSCCASFGDDCLRCGKWRSFRTAWLLGDQCENAHERVCDRCHQDIHRERGLPGIYHAAHLLGSDTDAESESVVIDDPKIIANTLLVTIDEMGGEGQHADIKRTVRGKLFEISCRRNKINANKEALLGVEKDGTDGYLKYLATLDITLLPDYDRTLKSLTLSYLIQRTKMDFKIQQAYGQLKKIGYCDGNTRRGIWRLNSPGRGLAQNTVL